MARKTGVVDAIESAKRLTHKTRNHVLTTKTKMTSIARACGVNRMTVTRILDGDDMPVSLFLAAMQESGGDPAQMLRDAEVEAGKAACHA